MPEAARRGSKINRKQLEHFLNFRTTAPDGFKYWQGWSRMVRNQMQIV